MPVLIRLQCFVLCRQYEAEIEEIDSENGTAAITFTGYGNAEVVPLQALKAAEQAKSSKDEGSKPKSKWVCVFVCVSIVCIERIYFAQYDAEC